MGKVLPFRTAGYDREEAFFYEQDQKLIQKMRRVERKKKEVSVKLGSSSSALKKAA